MHQEPNTRSSVDPRLAGEAIAAISALQAELDAAKADIEALVCQSQPEGVHDPATGGLRTQNREEPNDG